MGDAGSRICACPSPPCASTSCGHPGDPGAGRGAAAALTPVLMLSSVSLEGEDSSELVRHFLIESSAKGVHLKGASEELYFGKDKELYFGKDGAVTRRGAKPTGVGESPRPSPRRPQTALLHPAPFSCGLGDAAGRICMGGGSVVHGPADGWLCAVAGSLSAFVYQHAITPLALPCKLCIPTRGKPPRHGVLREEGGGPLF